MSELVLPRRRRRPTRHLVVPRWWLGAFLVAGPAGWIAAFALGWLLAPGVPMVPFRAAEPELISPAVEAAPKTLRAEAPASRPEAPTSSPGPPASRPEAPASRPEAPASRPEAPASRPEAPASRPEAPASRPEAPPDVVTPTASAPPPAVPAYARRAPRGRFGVQVAAYPTREEAEAFLLEQAAALALLRPVHVLEREVEGATWYRVRVGVFPSAPAAEAARAQLPDALGAGAMVTRYR